LADKLRTTEEKALRAIIRAEDSRRSYQAIKALIVEQKSPLTEIEVNLDPHLNDSTILTTKEDVETNLIL